MYNRDQVVEASLKYFKGDDLAANVWADKYPLKDQQNNYHELTPDDMHRRMARELARIEQNYPNPISEEEIYELMKGFRYIIPGGSSMSGMGNNFKIQSLSNCYVIGNKEDSYGSIIKIDEEQVHLMRRRGGVGSDLSYIRPNGTVTTCAANTSTGIVPFAERYSNSTRETAQDGRRGARMISIDIKHPDAEEFIDAKLEKGKITGANISVRIGDDFMSRVLNNEDYIQTFPIDLDIKQHTGFMESLHNDEIEYDKLYSLQYVDDNEYKGCYAKRKNAKKIWKKIINNAWKSAEPGILFIDQIRRESPSDCYGSDWKTESSNPCFTGDTKVMVADGRGDVDFKTLTEEGKDVLVYSFNKHNGVQINVMRNPRVSRRNVKVFKVILDSGDEIKATENHKFYLKYGDVVELKDLKYGDSLNIISRVKEQRITNNNYVLHFNGWAEKEHRFIARNLIKDLRGDLTVHHKDNNPFNKKKKKKKVLTIHEHNKRHNRVICGIGKNNTKYSGITDDELLNIAKKITIKYGRKISRREFVEAGGIYLSKYRVGLGKNTSDFLYKVADQLFEDKNLVKYDVRLISSYKKALLDKYKVKIKDNKVFVLKLCEQCGDEFWVDYQKREISFCKQRCALDHTNKYMRGKNIEKTRETYTKRAENRKKIEVQIYSDLKFVLKRNPKQYEFIKECQNKGFTPFRSKFSYKTIDEIKEDSDFYNHKVISIEFCGYEDVYNGTVDNDHNYFVGGFKSKTRSNFDKSTYCLSANCGEIPMNPYSSCILICLNLYSYVTNPFTVNSNFDFELFKKHVFIAQKMADDIVDMEIEKIDQILNKVKGDPESESTKFREIELWNKIRQRIVEGRRTGLGVTAEGDMIAAMGLRYGSEESIEFSTNVHKIMAIESYRSSIQMAEGRGAFPMWDFLKEGNNPFIQRIDHLLSFEDQQAYRNHGRRNIADLTIAPTGTTSLMTQTTSGIEPCFLPVYKRRRKTNDESKCTFRDEVGDMWEEYNVFHHKFVEWFDINWYKLDINWFDLNFKPNLEELDDKKLNDILEKSPYYKATSNDIDWNAKVRLQGSVQRWVDHSISCTTNVPKTASKTLVNDIYMTAWKEGCKGVTVYRDGSRSGVLISKENNIDDNNNFDYISSFKRPTVVDCNIHNISVKGEKITVLIGLINDKPFEVFAFDTVENIIFPNIIKKGVIKKIGRGVYHLAGKTGDKEYTLNLNKLLSNDEKRSTREFSTKLRHRISPQYIVEQEEKVSGDMGSFRKAIVRILKLYIKDGTKVSGSECLECGSELVFENGCYICKNCGNSKCF